MDPCANFGTLPRLIESVKSKKTDQKNRKKWVKSFPWILLLGHVVPKLNLITFSKQIEKLLMIPELDLPPVGEFCLSI